MFKFLTRFSTYTLLVALSISVVAEFYSIVGLTTIFSAAVIPVIIMGVVLGLGKLTATMWLKLNWKNVSFLYKLYLIPAIIVLMFLTSMGIFGFLSKAHSDQSLVSGDVQAKIAIYDEKIKTSRENIEANRKALKQMDEAVDQVLARSTTEQGADRSVTIRRSQQKERAKLQQEIEAEQKKIAALNDEAAPIRAEVRKVEAEVGPIKYIAAMIYGDNPDANLLEAAVRWVIILIVVVLDPLALLLLMASQQSIQWERQREREAEERRRQEEEAEEQGVHDFFEKAKLRARELDADEDARLVREANEKLAEIRPEPPEVFIPEPTIERDVSIAPVEWPEKPKYEQDDGPLTDEQIRQIKESVEEDIGQCYKCGTNLFNAPGIGPFCPNKQCDVVDGTSGSEVTFTSVSPKVEETIETEGVTEEKTLFDPNDGHVTYEGKKMSIESLKSLRPDLIMPSDGVVKNVIDFGTEFPKISLAGDTYIRIDTIPHRVYKFNGKKWMIVDKDQNTTYLTHVPYIRYLIQKIEQNEYDLELLSYAEQDEIESYLSKRKNT